MLVLDRVCPARPFQILKIVFSSSNSYILIFLHYFQHNKYTLSKAHKNGNMLFVKKQTVIYNQ